jgi:23S rRNA pseudouridine1911/1915/1917 synthase
LHSFALSSGDVVEVDPHAGAAARANLPFPVLYEDQEVIVVDKPAGISTSSTDGSVNIQQIVTKSLRNQSKGKDRAYVEHRLDRSLRCAFAGTVDGMNKIKIRKETESITTPG